MRKSSESPRIRCQKILEEQLMEQCILGTLAKLFKGLCIPIIKLNLVRIGSNMENVTLRKNAAFIITRKKREP